MGKKIRLKYLKNIQEKIKSFLALRGSLEIETGETWENGEEIVLKENSKHKSIVSTRLDPLLVENKLQEKPCPNLKTCPLLTTEMVMRTRLKTILSTRKERRNQIEKAILQCEFDPHKKGKVKFYHIEGLRICRLCYCFSLGIAKDNYYKIKKNLLNSRREISEMTNKKPNETVNWVIKTGKGGLEENLNNNKTYVDTQLDEQYQFNEKIIINHFKTARFPQENTNDFPSFEKGVHILTIGMYVIFSKQNTLHTQLGQIAKFTSISSMILIEFYFDLATFSWDMTDRQFDVKINDLIYVDLDPVKNPLEILKLIDL